MKVSIITVVYNGAKTIKDCIESVVNQSYKDIEYIVIDGKSTDSTPEIVRSYGTKIAVFLSEKDAGIYDAMNKGISLATGDVIGILNADDFYRDSSVIEKVVNTFTKTQADSIYADLLYVDSLDKTAVKRYWKSGAYKRQNFLYGWMPPHPTFFLRTASYKKYGSYRTDLGSAADYELMLRILYKNQVTTAYLAEVTTHMRIGGVSNSTISNRFDANKNDRRAWTLNDLHPYWFTTWLKPIRKVLQFVDKPKRTE
ncbi:glycosyltransferase family 2 protein [Runella sp. MFBS21]|uniref:glycosyltransferase family 2 protein n=1 Tax=Runella sp. MFBS21 TaxID=3034018 RepID=UPI0023FA26FE|nr:glycosyltransferase family 2 protein [Runella sp. MFBS21]MDF7819737.1 glycosyltransferase family 2 protein [Runella sp. MFBS21]